MNHHSLLINIDELLLKGRNRPLFMDSLNNHILKTLKQCHSGEIQYLRDNRRQIVESAHPFEEETLARLTKIPGIHSLFQGRKIPLDFELIFPLLEKELDTFPQLPQSFRVLTKRSYKGFPIDSMTVSERIGHLLLQKYPQMKVQLKNPELTIHIKIIEKGIFLSVIRREGIGGLPVGPSGHLLSMLSGGFDSPVASYLMSKRGCKLSFVFFHAYPFVGDEVKEKIFGLTKVLSQYQWNPLLYILPYGAIQKTISDHCRPSYRTLLFRKFMMECTSRLASRIGAQGIVTGDALGQVSSQTLANISFINQTTTLPILRPLIGLNKIEIINLAKKVGTHDISILPHDDACALFAARHPVTNPIKSKVDSFGQGDLVEQGISECLQKMEIYRAHPHKIERINPAQEAT